MRQQLAVVEKEGEPPNPLTPRASMLYAELQQARAEWAVASAALRRALEQPDKLAESAAFARVAAAANAAATFAALLAGEKT